MHCVQVGSSDSGESRTGHHALFSYERVSSVSTTTTPAFLPTTTTLSFRINQTAVEQLIAQLERSRQRNCFDAKAPIAGSGTSPTAAGDDDPLSAFREMSGDDGGGGTHLQRCDERWLFKALMGHGFLLLFCLALIGNVLNIAICRSRQICFFVAIRMLSVKIFMNTCMMLLMLPQALRVVRLWAPGGSVDLLYWLLWPFQAYFINVFGFCASWLTVMMTAECYMHVFRPSSSRALFTQRNVWRCYVVIVGVGLVLAAIYPLNRSVTLQFHCDNFVVFIDVSRHWAMEALEQAHTVANLFLSILLPLLLLVFMTLMLSWRLTIGPALKDRRASAAAALQTQQPQRQPPPPQHKGQTKIFLKKGSASSLLLQLSTCGGAGPNAAPHRPSIVVCEQQRQQQRPSVAAVSVRRHFAAEKRGVTRITLITTLIQLVVETPSMPVFVWAAVHGPHVVNDESGTMCTWQTVSHFLGLCNASLSFFVYLAFSPRFRKCLTRPVKIISHRLCPAFVEEERSAATEDRHKLPARSEQLYSPVLTSLSTPNGATTTLMECNNRRKTVDFTSSQLHFSGRRQTTQTPLVTRR